MKNKPKNLASFEDDTHYIGDDTRDYRVRAKQHGSSVQAALTAGGWRQGVGATQGFNEELETQ